MKIVVLDGYTINPGDNPWNEIAALGDLTVHDRTPPDQVVQRARGAHVVVTNKTRLCADVLARLPDLRLVAVLATGYDVIAIECACERGIAVANVPDYATDSVAQHTFALVLALWQRVAEHDHAVHAGRWPRSEDFCFWDTAPVELAGRTLGIVGVGRIGRKVGEIAHAFGMEVLGFSPSRRGALPYTRFAWVDLQELFGRADVVTLHCPLTNENARFVDADLLARMKPAAILINTARGALVDERALADALRGGRIAGAAVDVVAAEPIGADNPLLSAPACIITPHMAWSSLAARQRLMKTTAANIAAFVAGERLNRIC